MDKHEKKRVRRTQRRPTTKIHLDSLKATLGNVQNLKTPGNYSIRGYWF